MESEKQATERETVPQHLTSYKLIIDPALTKGLYKVYRFDGTRFNIPVSIYSCWLSGFCLCYNVVVVGSWRIYQQDWNLWTRSKTHASAGCGAEITGPGSYLLNLRYFHRDGVQTKKTQKNKNKTGLNMFNLVRMKLFSLQQIYPKLVYQEAEKNGVEQFIPLLLLQINQVIRHR